MQLSKRLHAVADLVTQGNRVADVGCDHAYISIHLTENQISPYVIAMDVNQGPIDRAKENIIKYGYEDRIEVRKSDGLVKLDKNEADTILIAGMGGALMIQILTSRMDIVESVRELVLQPQSEIHLVRKMLKDIGFLIIGENMIKEDGKYYVMMRAQAKAFVSEDQKFDLTKEEHFYFGRLLLEQNHPVLKEFLLKELKLCETITQALLPESTVNSVNRQKEIQEKKDLIHCALDYYNKKERECK
jgi:tRNA (adenine22-N1)-methyltransferase